jgi:F-type H+-transporting ATPase subunit delta
MKTTRRARDVQPYHGAIVPARNSARVQTAFALSGNLKARVRADLIRLYGPIRVSFVEIPALSGGMRIIVGDDLYFGSVSNTLAELEDRLDH